MEINVEWKTLKLDKSPQLRISKSRKVKPMPNSNFKRAIP